MWGLLSSCGMWVPIAVAPLVSTGSRVHGLQQLRLAGSRVWAQELWCAVPGARLPRPGIEPMSPTLAGGHLTTGPPGKPNNYVLIEISEVTIIYMQFKEIEILDTFYSVTPNVSILQNYGTIDITTRNTGIDIIHLFFKLPQVLIYQLCISPISSHICSCIHRQSQNKEQSHHHMHPPTCLFVNTLIPTPWRTLMIFSKFFVTLDILCKWNHIVTNILKLAF